MGLIFVMMEVAVASMFLGFLPGQKKEPSSLAAEEKPAALLGDTKCQKQSKPYVRAHLTAYTTLFPINSSRNEAKADDWLEYLVQRRTLQTLVLEFCAVLLGWTAKVGHSLVQ